MRFLDEIIIHCTATRPSWMEERTVHDVMDTVRSWHVEDRGWSDVGYHAIIHRDGSVAFGRPIERTGAHVRGRNKSTIGVSLVGGFGGSSDDLFSDNYTDEQEDALRELIGEWQHEYPTIDKVSGHNEYANKACPCFSVSAWF